MKRHLLLVFAVLGFVAFPQLAWANAGTSLMWAGMLHLVFGNLVIGFGEGLLLAWLFSVPKGKSVLVMILANYASAWVGGLYLRGAIVRELPMDLNKGWRWFWVMVVLTYGMTLVLEWPFIAWCFRGTQGWFRRSVRASLVVQSASYVLLFGWYWGASGTSLYTKMKTVAPSELSLPESVLVYFIAPKDGNVYARHLMGGDERLVYDLHSTDADDRLLVRASTPDTNAWDLVARLETSDHRNPKLVVIRTNLQVEAAPDWRNSETDPPRYEGTWFSFGEAQPLGGARDGQWEFRTGFWPIEGLRASNKRTGENVRFSYETPFGAWTARNAVHLPSDKALFQLGDDQICAFDPASKKIALLWHGRGPVPVIARSKDELDASPNGTPVKPFGNSRAGGGAPSVTERRAVSNL